MGSAEVLLVEMGSGAAALMKERVARSAIAPGHCGCYITPLFPFSLKPTTMPTYDYRCEKCKKSFEAFQSMKDEAFTICPKELCRQKTWGKGKVVRQLGTGAGIIFKGSGFYITDYRSEGYKSAAQKESGGGGESAPAKEGAKTEAKSETKTEKKTESKPAASETKPKGGAKKE
jgi:putative FmdB family regulatory protein